VGAGARRDPTAVGEEALQCPHGKGVYYFLGVPKVIQCFIVYYIYF
jgi:hypothetical protein